MRYRSTARGCKPPRGGPAACSGVSFSILDALGLAYFARCGTQAVAFLHMAVPARVRFHVTSRRWRWVVLTYVWYRSTARGSGPRVAVLLHVVGFPILAVCSNLACESSWDKWSLVGAHTREMRLAFRVS